MPAQKPADKPLISRQGEVTRLVWTGLSESGLEGLAVGLADLSECGDILLLRGELGAGKTTLARAFIRSYTGNPREEVPSPTYNLVQTYAAADSARPAVWHFDFYRIANPSEVAELGLEEAFAEGISLIEWPEHAPDAAPEQALQITLEDCGDEDLRVLTIAGGGSWRERLAKLGSVAL